MDSVLVYSNGDNPPDRWRFTARTIMEFCTAESQTALGDAFELWLRSLPEGRYRGFDPLRGDLLGVGFQGELVGLEFRDFADPPPVSAFSPEFGSAFSANVSTPDPSDFVIISEDGPPIRLDNIKNPLLNRALMSDLLICRGSRCPAYHQIEQDTDGRHLRYMRLLLPVRGMRRDVVKIYAFCRSLLPSKLNLEQLMAIPT